MNLNPSRPITMKSNKPSATDKLQVVTMHPAALLMLAGVFMASPIAQGQGDKEAPSTAEIKAEDLATTPSRLIGDDVLDTYMDSQISRMAIGQRKMDPFGQVQDPTVQKVVKDVNTGPRRFKPIKPTSFSDIIQRIRVNTIMPGEDKFLIGTRSFKKGDQFPIIHQRRNIDVEVIRVTATEIEFENVKTGEVASVKLNLLPAGMQSGTSGMIKPGGLEEDDNKAPLQLGGGN